MKKNYYMVKIKIPSNILEEFQLYLNENISWGWEENNSNIYKIYFSLKTEQEEFIKKITQRFPDIFIETKKIYGSNWADEWKKYFHPMEIGIFKILPSWLNKNLSDRRFIPIIIYPEMAFGTGHHPTTRLCLLAIQTLFKEGKLQKGNYFLDVGTGSGILGIGASLLGMRGIGLDIDPLISGNCKKNIRLNKVDKNFSLYIGGIDALKKGINFDLIMANLLLEPLVDLKEKLYMHLTPRGILIVSGILIEQELKLITNYQDLFSNPFKILREKEWSAIIWIKG